MVTALRPVERRRPHPSPDAAADSASSAPSQDATTAHLTAVYQPVVHLATGQVIAAEALTRFLASDRTSEQWFAQAAADGTGVALEIAAAQAALRGLPMLPENTRLALNFSPAALLHPTAAALLMPHAPRLIVEMTEREPVHHFDRPRQALDRPRGAGAQLAADDVGTGYANFAHISQFKPDIVKLDHAIIRGVVDDHVCRAFVAAVAGFAADIGVRVVAEGIETHDQLHQLRVLGVDHGQGYLLGRPGAPVRIRRLHARST